MIAAREIHTMSSTGTKVRANGKANLRRLDKKKLADYDGGKSKLGAVRRQRRKNLIALVSCIGLCLVVYTFANSSRTSSGKKYLRDRLERAKSFKDTIYERHYPKRKPITNSKRYLDPRQLATLPGKEPDEYKGGNGHQRPWGEGEAVF